MESGTCCSRPILALHNFAHIKTGKTESLFNGCLSLVVAQASAICPNCLRRSPNCPLSLLIMCAAVSEEAAASDILVGAQPRITCWTRARSSSSELVDTATARRRQQGRHAWEKSAIMHWGLPPDVTLDAPYWWQPEMPLFPPVGTAWRQCH